MKEREAAFGKELEALERVLLGMYPLNDKSTEVDVSTPWIRLHRRRDRWNGAIAEYRGTYVSEADLN